MYDVQSSHGWRRARASKARLNNYAQRVGQSTRREMAGFARKYDGGLFDSVARFARDARDSVSRAIHRQPASSGPRNDDKDAVGIKVCAEDFDRILACKNDPPNLSEAIIRANERHRLRLRRLARSS